MVKNVKKEVAVMFTVRVLINKLYLIPKPIMIGLQGSRASHVFDPLMRKSPCFLNVSDVDCTTGNLVNHAILFNQIDGYKMFLEILSSVVLYAETFSGSK